MRGPHGKGYAEMAVARVPGMGFETPLVDDDRQRFDEFSVRFHVALTIPILFIVTVSAGRHGQPTLVRHVP